MEEKMKKNLLLLMLVSTSALLNASEQRTVASWMDEDCDPRTKIETIPSSDFDAQAAYQELTGKDFSSLTSVQYAPGFNNDMKQIKAQMFQSVYKHIKQNGTIGAYRQLLFNNCLPSSATSNLSLMKAKLESAHVEPNTVALMLNTTIVQITESLNKSYSRS